MAWAVPPNRAPIQYSRPSDETTRRIRDEPKASGAPARFRRPPRSTPRPPRSGRPPRCSRSWTPCRSRDRGSRRFCATSSIVPGPRTTRAANASPPCETEADLVALQGELREQGPGHHRRPAQRAHAASTPRITGTIARDGYRIEKVVFESLPGLHVTALLYVPDGPIGATTGRARGLRSLSAGQGLPRLPGDRRAPGEARLRGPVLGPGGPGRAQPVLGRGAGPKPIQPGLRRARRPGQPRHPRGHQPRALHGVGRDARPRLSPDPAGSGRRPDRGHGHERRRVPVALARRPRRAHRPRWRPPAS